MVPYVTRVARDGALGQWPRRAARALVAVCLAFTAAACATHRVTAASSPRVVVSGSDVVEEARRYTGVNYRSGGQTPGSGFDCSGFVQYVFGQVGIALPRTAAAQYGVGEHVKSQRIAPGDLVFFRTEGRRVSHVGVATGDGGFIHAPNARSRVRIDRLDDTYWSKRYAGARRIR